MDALAIEALLKTHASELRGGSGVRPENGRYVSGVWHREKVGRDRLAANVLRDLGTVNREVAVGIRLTEGAQAVEVVDECRVGDLLSFFGGEVLDRQNERLAGDMRKLPIAPVQLGEKRAAEPHDQLSINVGA
jgi:hypothetical protein